MKTVIVINGKARAGKDTAIACMRNILKANGIESEAFSSIDPVRQMLHRAGLNTDAKTPADRALLAEVGDSVEKHSYFRSTRSFMEIHGFFMNTEDRPAVVFLHVREPAIIERIGGKVRSRGWRMVHIFVRSDREEDVTSNAADMGVANMRYDTTIHNNGTLDDLARACDQTLFANGVIEQLSLLHRRSIQHNVD